MMYGELKIIAQKRREKASKWKLIYRFSKMLTSIAVEAALGGYLDYVGMTSQKSK